MFKGVGTNSATAEESLKMLPRCEKSKTYFLNLNKKTVGSMSVDVWRTGMKQYYCKKEDNYHWGSTEKNVVHRESIGKTQQWWKMPMAGK